MNAEKLDKLSDSELNELRGRNESVSDRQQKGEITIEQALTEAKEVQLRMSETFDRNIPTSPLRLKVWNENKNLIQILEAEKFDEDRLRGAKFPAGSILDIEARTKIQETRRVVNSMTLNGRKTPTKEELRYFEGETRTDGSVSDEQYSLIRISMLSDYGKYIDEDHSEMKKLRQAYHDRCLNNYEDYAKSQYRNATRDAGLGKKISENIKLGKYSNEALAQAVVNMLQPVI
jgi:hypothetical protein